MICMTEKDPNYYEFDIKTITAEELIQLLNLEHIHWTTNFHYGDTLTCILGSRSELMLDKQGNPKTDEKGNNIYRFSILRTSAKNKLEPIKVKIPAKEDPIANIDDGTKVILKKPVYHRGYFESGNRKVKWENLTAEAIKKA